MKKRYLVPALLIFFSAIVLLKGSENTSEVVHKNTNQQIFVQSTTQLTRNKLEIIRDDAIRQREEQLRIEKEYLAQQEAQNVVTNSYTEEDLYLLAHLIYGESSGCSNELQLAVGSVVLNRVKSAEYPNTIKDVIYQKGQYACIGDGNFEKTPDEQTVNNAEYLLMYGSQIPENVIFQAEFKQGIDVWQQINNTFFCYK